MMWEKGNVRKQFLASHERDCHIFYHDVKINGTLKVLTLTLTSFFPLAQYEKNIPCRLFLLRLAAVTQCAQQEKSECMIYDTFTSLC